MKNLLIVGMNYRNNLFLCLLFLFFIGCKTKQKIVEKVETNKSDTLIVKSQTVETPPILSSLTINEICDTITGEAKEFKNKVIIDKDTVYVEVIDNELNVNVNRLKQTLSEKESQIAIRDTQIKELKEDKTVRNRIPFKYWVFLIVSILGNIYFIYRMFKPSILKLRNKLPF